MTTLSIVIVNWNSKDLLRKCLLSVYQYALEMTAQIIVVDGGSFDGCAEMLAAEFPEVEFVQSKDNIGFGRANNLGFARATGEALLLLNPDAELSSNALQRLLVELQRRTDAGIIGPRLLNTDLTLQTSVQALPRPVRQAFDSELLRRLLWPVGLWAPPTRFVPAGSIEVEATSGACMLLWSRVFREVGGFSPQYFMYAEDVDLCLKVLRKGLRIYHVPDAKIIHHGGASSATQGSAFSAVMMREALCAYMVLNHNRFHAWLYRAATAVAALARLLPLTLSAVFLRDSRRAARKAAVAVWWSVLAWSFGGQKWTRRYV